MALNLKSTLEILKRAGLDPDDTMQSSRTERRMAGLERQPEQDLPDPTDLAWERARYHSNPQNMTRDQLLDIDEL